MFLNFETTQSAQIVTGSKFWLRVLIDNISSNNHKSLQIINKLPNCFKIRIFIIFLDLFTGIIFKSSVFVQLNVSKSVLLSYSSEREKSEAKYFNTCPKKKKNNNKFYKLSCIRTSCGSVN